MKNDINNKIKKAILICFLSQRQYVGSAIRFLFL